MIISKTPTIAEIEQEIVEVREDIENVNSDLRGDDFRIGTTAIGVALSCPNIQTGAGAISCGIAYTGNRGARKSRERHVAEKEGYEQEEGELELERDNVVANIQETAWSFQETLIETARLENERGDAEGILDIAETNLEEAEGELGRFKNRYDID